MKVSIVIPCFNEGRTIAEVIDRILQVRFDCEREIIVVDDGSTDGSDQIIKTFSEVKLVTHETNRGKGAAIRTGIETASGDVLVIQDADMEYRPSFLPELVDPIFKGEADVVIGSRFLGQVEGMSWSHAFGNKVLSWTASLLTGQAVTDVMTGHKAFRTSLLREMRLKSGEFEIEVELIARAAKRRARISEIPITYSYRKAGTAKIGWRHGVSSFLLLLRLALGEPF